MEAAVNGNHEQIENLLKTSDVIVQLKRLDGNLSASPAHLAAAKGHIEILRSLFDAGLPVEMKDKFGRTPLDHAVIEHQREAVSFLLDRGANREAKTSSFAFDGKQLLSGAAELTPLYIGGVRRRC